MSVAVRRKFAPKRVCPGRARAAGFTLLELLVVVAILVAVAVIAAPSVVDSITVAEGGMANSEIRELAEGIQRFQQDTGFYPKTGPFARVADGGQVPDADPLDVPANLVQLLVSPTDAASAEIMPWNPDTGRGWRGPYISSFGEGTVTVGQDFDPTGVPTSGPLDGAAIEVTGVADPFERVPAGAYLEWREPISGRVVIARGRPYLLFVDPAADDPGNVDGCVVPCLLSMGPDGEYDAGGDDDIVLNL